MVKFGKILGSDSTDFGDHLRRDGCQLSDNFTKVEMLDSEYFVSICTVASLGETKEMDRAFFISGDALDFVVEGFGLEFQ